MKQFKSHPPIEENCPHDVFAPGSCAAQREGEPGCGELHGELAAEPRKLPLLLADPEPDRVDDVSDLSSSDPLLATIPVGYQCHLS